MHGSDSAVICLECLQESFVYNNVSLRYFTMEFEYCVFWWCAFVGMFKTKPINSTSFILAKSALYLFYVIVFFKAIFNQTIFSISS